MAQTITTDTRTDAVKTVSSHYFFNAGGTWGGATVTLEWSESGESGTWYPIKDSADLDVSRTANSNGIVTVGKNGFLSAIASDTGGSTSIQVSLIPV